MFSWLAMFFTLLLKYGTQAFGLIKAAYELYLWIKKNDHSLTADEALTMKADVHAAAAIYKDTKNDALLNQVISKLQERKANVARFKR